MLSKFRRWPIFRGFSISIGLAVGLAGCSLHPLPDDVSLSRANTFAIVQNIRCEVKKQAQSRLEELLANSDSPYLQNITIDEVTDQFKKIGLFRGIDQLQKVDKNIAYKVLKYGSIVIGYSFNFFITEDNNNKASAEFRVPFTNTTFSLSGNANADFQRQATRTFAVTDTFIDLLLLECPDDLSGPNPAYPITGSIGAGRIIDTYLDLGKSGVTGGFANAAYGSNFGTGGRAGPFKDQIVFTTKVGADITPKVEIAPASLPMGKLRLLKAEGTFGAKRHDVHSVTIIIPFPSFDDRVGSVHLADVPLNAEDFSTAYKKAITDANRTVAIELCIQRAIENRTGAEIGAVEPAEIYCNQFPTLR